VKFPERQHLQGDALDDPYRQGAADEQIGHHFLDRAAFAGNFEDFNFA
jgi:hypothetical protein